MATKKPIPKADKAAPKKVAAVCDSGSESKIVGNSKRKKYGGRKKGTENKATVKTREVVIALIDKLAPDVETKMEQLEPRDWLNVYVKLLDFVMPKLAAIPGTPKENDDNMDRLFKAAAKVMESNA